MMDFLKDILFAIITAAVPVLTAYLMVYIRKAGDNAAANTENVKARAYIKEAAEAVAAAVAATNQTYVDALKDAGSFDAQAQRQAAEKALKACLASISPAAKSFIEAAYGDLSEYLTTRIEAEVRKQKNEAPLALSVPMFGELVSTAETTAEKTE